MLNHITLMGRLVQNPELKHTPQDVAVTAFTLAVDRDRKDQNGERKADFIEIVAWRNTAEYVCKYLTKGRMVVVSGRLQFRDYTDKEGNKRKAAEVVADTVYFADSRRDATDETRPNTAPAASKAPPTIEYEEVPMLSDDDLPF